MSRRSTALARAGVVFALAAAPLEAQSSDPFAATPPERLVAPPIAPVPFHHAATVGAIRAYQGLLSRGRVSTCPMSPSCSRYAIDAFRERGFFGGWFATSDRLQRCSHDLARYSRIDDGTRSRRHDPVLPIPAPSNAARLDPPIAAQEARRAAADDPDAARLLHFARTLHVEGDHDRALTEYRRLLSYFPHAEQRNEAAIGAFRCYYALGKYAEAIRWRDQILEKGLLNAPQISETTLWASAAFYRMGNHRRSRDLLASAEADEPELASRLLLLTASAHAADGDWTGAAQVLARVEGPAPAAARARELAALCDEAQRSRSKKPALAGALALVPGAGYLYDGYPESALAALIVNGLFMAATYEAFKNDETALGVVLGTFGLGWYGGNIYGSVVTAQRQNAAAQQGLLLRFDIGFRF